YEDGIRQQERLDNSNIIDQLEAKIRAKAIMLDKKQKLISVNSINDLIK
ncbi:MAG: flavodoxin-dependent (E)-4-hydroxy-3-methylbut-2-enyl-diphosphate synthase, partial [Arsenophonus sp. ET-DL12-MAG3]